MKKLFLLIAVFTSLVIVACTSEREPEDLVLTLDWFPNANHAGIYEAVGRGYFADEGLNVSVVPPADPSAILSLVASGQSDFGMFYQPDLMQARDAGVPVVAILCLLHRQLNKHLGSEVGAVDAAKFDIQ